MVPNKAMALAVAYDVLWWIASDLIDVATGCYLYWKPNVDFIDPTKNNSYDAKELLPTPERIKELNDSDGIENVCQACAMGMLMMSKARLFNEVPGYLLIMRERSINDSLRPFATREAIHTALEDCFGIGQLGLIEAAFERTVNYALVYCYNNSITTARNAEKFGLRYRHPAERLKQIMYNIIYNDGEFIPTNHCPDGWEPPALTKESTVPPLPFFYHV